MTIETSEKNDKSDKENKIMSKNTRKKSAIIMEKESILSLMLIIFEGKDILISDVENLTHDCIF